jgi:Putative Ig domain
MSATCRLRLACAVTAAVSAAALGLSGASPVAASPSPGRPAAATSAGRLTALASTGRPASGHSPLRGAGGSAAAGDARSACPSQAQVACTALLRADRPARAGVQQAVTSLPGYSPADLQSAYNLIAAAAADGKDATIAVIGAYDDPDAESDLAVYRAQYGLPPCTSADGCFTELNENGQASPLPGSSDDPEYYGAFESIDLDLVSAVCPNCNIDLLETSTAEVQDMGTAVDSAVSLGARFVVIGWTSPNGGYDARDGTYFDHPGVAITVPAGDNGFSGFCCEGGDYYPTASQYVTAVGGTTLLPAANARGWTESVWGPSDENDYRGTGSGCSRYQGKPSWQTDTGCANRTYNDVAAVADPDPGVSVYDSDTLGGWMVAGGTTVSAAIVGAVYALAGPPAAGTYPSSYPWLHSADLNDVTSGNNADGACTPSYLCTAGPGYDGPSGWGTPDGTGAFALGSMTGNLISVIGPGTQKDTAPEAVNVPVEAVDTGAGQTLTYSAAGLPPGVSIDSSTGVISGTTSALYSGNATVTVTDGTGAHASVTFPWTVINYVNYFSPGRQQTEPDTAVTLKIPAEDSNRSQTLTYSATGLPAGLSIDSSTGEVTGTTEGIAPYEVTVTATDTVGATASVSFTWTVARRGYHWPTRAPQAR